MTTRTVNLIMFLAALAVVTALLIVGVAIPLWLSSAMAGLLGWAVKTPGEIVGK